MKSALRYLKEENNRLKGKEMQHQFEVSLPPLLKTTPKTMNLNFSTETNELLRCNKDIATLVKVNFMLGMPSLYRNYK